MALVIVLPIAVLTALEIPAHSSLGRDEIRARGYGFGSTQIYRYSEARKLTIIQGFRNRDGGLVKRAGVALEFANGRRWSSADIGDFQPNVDPKLVSFLQANPYPLARISSRPNEECAGISRAVKIAIGKTITSAIIRNPQAIP